MSTMQTQHTLHICRTEAQVKHWFPSLRVTLKHDTKADVGKHVSTQTDDSSVPNIDECMVAQLVTSVSESVSSKVLTEHIRPLFAALRDDIVASVTETILQLSEHIVAATDRSLQPAHDGVSFAHEQHGSSSFGSARGAHSPAVKDTVMGSLRGFWSAIQQKKTSGDDAGTTANSHSTHCVHLRVHIGPSLLGAETAFMKELEAALKKEHIRLSRSPSAGVPTVSLVLHRGGSRTQRTMEDLTATYAHLTELSTNVRRLIGLFYFDKFLLFVCSCVCAIPEPGAALRHAGGQIHTRGP